GCSVKARPRSRSTIDTIATSSCSTSASPWVSASWHSWSQTSSVTGDRSALTTARRRNLRRRAFWPSRDRPTRTAGGYVDGVMGGIAVLEHGAYVDDAEHTTPFNVRRVSNRSGAYDRRPSGSRLGPMCTDQSPISEGCNPDTSRLAQR